MKASFSSTCVITTGVTARSITQFLLHGVTFTLTGLIWLALPVHAQTDWSGDWKGKSNQTGQSTNRSQTYGNYNPYGSTGSTGNKQTQQQQAQSPDLSGRTSQQQSYNQPQQQKPSQTYNVQSTQSYIAPQVQPSIARTPTGPIKFFEGAGKKRLKKGEVVPDQMMPKVP